MDSAQQALRPSRVVIARHGDDGYYDWDFYNEGVQRGNPSEPRAASLPDSYLWAHLAVLTAKASAPRVSGTTTPGDESACPESRGGGAAAAAPVQRPLSADAPASPPAAAAETPER